MMVDWLGMVSWAEVDEEIGVGKIDWLGVVGGDGDGSYIGLGYFGEGGHSVG